MVDVTSFCVQEVNEVQLEEVEEVAGPAADDAEQAEQVKQFLQKEHEVFQNIENDPNVEVSSFTPMFIQCHYFLPHNIDCGDLNIIDLHISTHTMHDSSNFKPLHIMYIL